ncbi:MAG: YlbF family regulator [Gammaproteobacteria bacterium]|nr:YlbF family regulator [Gammaproteobacteria bacterium]
MDQQLDNIVTEAGKLGKLIAASAASKVFMQMQKMVEADSQAVQLVEDYQRQVQKIAELESHAKPIEPEDKHQLTELQQNMASNETLKSWMKAQADFSEMMSKVNKAILEPFQDTPADQNGQGAAKQDS